MCKEINSINGLVFSFRFNDVFFKPKYAIWTIAPPRFVQNIHLDRSQRSKYVIINESTHSIWVVYLEKIKYVLDRYICKEIKSINAIVFSFRFNDGF